MNHANAKKSRFHFASLKKSKGLQRLYKYLKSHRGATTREISEACELQSVSTWASALRHNGVEVFSHYSHVSDDGAKIYKYFLSQKTA